MKPRGSFAKALDLTDLAIKDLQQLMNKGSKIALPRLLRQGISSFTVEELEEVRLAMLGHASFHGVVRARAEVFDNDWRWLVDEGFVSYSFCSWEHQQYGIRITQKGAQFILDNLVEAVSALIELVPGAIRFAEFLTQFMSEGQLPAFLSHEKSGMRAAATAQLKKLAEAAIGDEDGT